MKYYFITALVVVFSFASCNKTKENKEETIKPKTPVEVISIKNGSIADNLDLSATTIYLKRNLVTATIPAFITQVNVKLGDKVSRGDLLYVLQSKESKALGSDAAKIDASLTGFGIVKIRASSDGIVSTLDRQQVGEYVLEGTQLCSIAENNDLVFQVNVPFEYANFAKLGKRCTITLPDNRVFTAQFTKALTSMNVSSQTQTILAKSTEKLFLPENMMVKVSIDQDGKKTNQIIPKSCVLSDELMEIFWVFKVENNNAIKIPIIIGNKNEDNIEVLSPVFNENDKIINSGNYGLSDKDLVEIKNKNR